MRRLPAIIAVLATLGFTGTPARAEGADMPPAAGTQETAAPPETAVTLEVPAEPGITDAEKTELRFDARRKRLSFQARFSGGLDLMRAADGVGGLIQIGIGTGRWFDIHTGVGFPSYAWVTDFELNMYPFGRFVPVLGLRVALGFLPNHEAYAVEAYAGCEFWFLDWLGAHVRVGIGHTWNPSWNLDYLVVPAWVGIEMRY
ncbi:MAG TPA: hypothetical protein PLY68_07315 [Myxococcota bacterium]|nr:hypothetical protein [Myxococcota bacterium]HNZ03686.1 hypothetical protein [Myxococcota bacterium]HOD07888.1 hypothetical protein [Myxococcota bacterium]HPB51243.1 hypothetical protein [Myxococcota bacterium]HQP95987.1 hypothetical protein [Myxococcota bacterium]